MSNNVVPDPQNVNIVSPIIRDNIGIKLGRNPGEYIVDKFCRNPDVDGPEDIWNGGGVYTGFPAVAEELEVFSSDANDTLLGTGSRVLRIFYLDANYEMFDINEEPLFVDVNMNGLTPVSTGVVASRVWRAFVVSSGTATGSVGSITIRHVTTTANIFAVIPAGFSQTQLGSFTIPLGWSGVLTQYGATLFDNNANTAEMVIKARAFNSGTFIFTRPFPVSNNVPEFFTLYGGDVYAERTDVVLSAVSVVNVNANISGQYAIHLVKNEV